MNSRHDKDNYPILSLWRLFFLIIYCCTYNVGPMIKNKSGRLSQGMTIIEVLMVLAIISIMTAISLFYVNSDNFKLNAEARNLRSALTQARMDAVQTNQKATVKLWTDKYEDSRGAIVDLSSNDIMLTFSGGGSLPSGGYTLSFSPSGTTSNSHYHMTNRSGNSISIQMNSVGRVWLE